MFSWDFEFADVQRDITIASIYPGDSEPLRGIRAEYLPESCLQDCYELIRCAFQRRHDALRAAAPFPEGGRPEGQRCLLQASLRLLQRRGVEFRPGRRKGAVGDGMRDTRQLHDEAGPRYLV